MNIEDIIKSIFPIILFLGTVFFIKKNNIVGEDRLLIWLFWGYFCLSSNFHFFFREMYQCMIAFICIKVFKHIRVSLILFPVIFFLFFFIIIILSYYANDMLFSTVAMSNILNYISVSLTTISVISLFIRRRFLIGYLTKYLKYIILIASLFIIVLGLIVGGRVELTFSNPNYLSFFLGFSIVFILYNDNSHKYRELLLLLGLTSILFTGSRSILLIILPIVLFYYFKKKIRYFIGIFICFLLVGVIYYDQFLEISRLSNISEDTSVIERREIRLVVQNIFSDKPVLGVGYGNFINVFTNYVPRSVLFLDEREQIVTHNDFFRVLSELGLVGLALFVFFILKNINIGFSLKKERLFLLSLIMIVLSYSLTHNNLNSFLFWVSIFMPYIYYKINVTNSKIASG